MVPHLLLLIIFLQWNLKMANIPAYIQKTLKMKPEVEKVFDDLDKWLDYCRFNLINFNPADMYRSREWRDSARGTGEHRERKPYLGNKPRWDNTGRRNEQNFSR